MAAPAVEEHAGSGRGDEGRGGHRRLRWTRNASAMEKGDGNSKELGRLRPRRM